MTAGRRVWVFGGAGGVGTSTVAGLLALELAQPSARAGPGPGRSVQVVDWVGDGSPWPAWTQTGPAAAEGDTRCWERVVVAPAADATGWRAGPVEGWVVVDAGRASLRPERWDGWRPDGPVVLVVSSADGPIYRAERAARLAAGAAGEVTVVVTDVCDGRRPAAVKAGVAALAAHHRVITVGFDRALRAGGLARPAAVSARTWAAVAGLARPLHTPPLDTLPLDDRGAVGESPGGTGNLTTVDLRAVGRRAVDLRAGSAGEASSLRPGEGLGAGMAGAEREEIHR